MVDAFVNQNDLNFAAQRLQQNPHGQPQQGDIASRGILSHYYNGDGTGHGSGNRRVSESYGGRQAPSARRRSGGRSQPYIRAHDIVHGNDLLSMMSGNGSDRMPMMDAHKNLCGVVGCNPKAGVEVYDPFRKFKGRKR